MNNSVYTINKGINQPVVFKGLRAQYIWWLGGGLVLLMILFAVLYICAVPIFLCLGVTGMLGGVLFTAVYRMSRVYGEHGLMKKIARKSVPKVIRNNSIQRIQNYLLQ